MSDDKCPDCGYYAHTGGCGFGGIIGRRGSVAEGAAIKAAFPTRTGRHDLWAEAMRLVGARHAKGDLVELVNWLLATIDEYAEKAQGARAAERERIAKLCDERVYLYRSQLQSAPWSQEANECELLARVIRAMGDEP